MRDELYEMRRTMIIRADEANQRFLLKTANIRLPSSYLFIIHA